MKLTTKSSPPSLHSKTIILAQFSKLVKQYQQNETKKYNLRALRTFMHHLKKYDGPILSGSQLQESLQGIGPKIKARIDEILTTGRLSELSEVDDINSLLQITGMGLTRAKEWYSQGIRTIEDARKAIHLQKTHAIEIGMKYYEDFQQKIPREDIQQMHDFLQKELRAIDPHIVFDICGSYRRGEKESGDIDVLLSLKGEDSEVPLLQKVVAKLTDIGFLIDTLTSKGKTKWMGVCRIKQMAARIDLRVVPMRSYAMALLSFTGSKEFNISLRKRAIDMGMRINEYYILQKDGKERIYPKTEKQIFNYLQIPYIPPSKR